MLATFFKGLVIGLIIAMPFGPLGLLCLQRAIVMGLRAGLSSGAGAASADALYGAVAAFGLTYISDFLNDYHQGVQAVGGMFLVLMGLRLMYSTMPPRPVAPKGHHFAGAFASVFLLALTNPMTFLAFVAIFAGFGLGQAETRVHHAAAVVFGVFCGSMIWWTAIALGGKMLRFRLLNQMPRIKRYSGATVLLFGLWAVADVFV